jgi:K+ transporter
MLGLFGAALLYGDGVITPAISVLSAVEGVTVAAPVLTRLVVPVTVLILFGLFYIQRRGTALVGAIAHYGFMEQPNVMGLVDSLHDLVGEGPWRAVKPMETTFYLGRETLLPTGASRLAHWRKRLFILMSRNSATASAFFGLPAGRVVELGAQIEL